MSSFKPRERKTVGRHMTLSWRERERERVTECVCVCVCVHACARSVLSNSFAAPWTEAFQAPLSKGFHRQKYWSGLPFPCPGDLPEPGIEPKSPALAGGFFATEPPGKPSWLERIGPMQTSL